MGILLLSLDYCSCIIPRWLGNIFYMILIIWNLLRLALQSHAWSMSNVRVCLKRMGYTESALTFCVCLWAMQFVVHTLRIVHSLLHFPQVLPVIRKTMLTPHRTVNSGIHLSFCFCEFLPASWRLRYPTPRFSPSGELNVLPLCAALPHLNLMPFTLISILPAIARVIPAFFWLKWTWNVVFHSFAFLPFFLRYASCKSSVSLYFWFFFFLIWPPLS